MNIVIVCTGYFSLISGSRFSGIGIDITCVDIEENKITRLFNDETPIYEPGLGDWVTPNVKADHLYFITYLPSCLDKVEIAPKYGIGNNQWLN